MWLRCGRLARRSKRCGSASLRLLPRSPRYATVLAGNVSLVNGAAQTSSDKQALVAGAHLLLVGGLLHELTLEDLKSTEEFEVRRLHCNFQALTGACLGLH